MAIDPTKEPVKPLSELDFHKGAKPSYQSRIRYVTQGMRTVDGSRYVRLEAIKIGGSWHSSQQAVERLIEAVNTESASAIGV